MHRKFTHLCLGFAQHNTDAKKKDQADHKLYMKTIPTANLRIAAGKAQEAVHRLFI